jgi:hypothetical protein
MADFLMDKNKNIFFYYQFLPLENQILVAGKNE